MSIRNQINKELGGKEDIFVGMEIKTRSPVTGGRDSLNLQWQAIQKEKLKGLEQKVKGHKPRFTIGDRVSQSPQPQQPQPQQQQSQSQPQQPQPQSQSQQQPQQESIPPISQTTSQQTQSPTITFETFKQQPESINQSEEETCLQTTVTETTPLLGESNNQSKGQKKQRRCCC
jgi:transcription initiation factor TFIID subunit TAF12